MVTGATRGIGKATAEALAASGWDVAVTGRTVRQGEGRDHSDTGQGRPLPGSLEETGALVRSRGVRALELAADLHDRHALRASVARVVEAWGGVDLLVNNAVDTGPGSMVSIVDLTVAQLEAKLEANLVAPFILVQAVLPGMLETGGGTIVNVTSHTATADPPGPVGAGGWGLGYAASKAAIHRMAPLLAVELGDRGIRAFNVDPGYVETERQRVNAAALGPRCRHRLVGRAPRRGGERPDGPGPEDGPHPRPPSGLAAGPVGAGLTGRSLPSRSGYRTRVAGSGSAGTPP
jgi:NAD(P)-dependent dehydrogenase (short-subunit alcohol dehydrogenase family)